MAKENSRSLTVTMDLLPDEPPKGVYIADFELDKLVPDDMLIGPNPDADFIKSLMRIGQLTPILVVEAEGKYGIISGRRRVKAMRALGYLRCQAIVFPSGTGVDVMTLVENTERSINAASELAAIETLMRDKRATDKDIQLASGMDIQTIRKRLKLLKLTLELREHLNHGGMTLDQAEKLCRLSREEQNAFLEENEGKITNKAISELFRVKKEDVVASLPEDMFQINSVQVTGPTESTQERTYQLVREEEEEPQLERTVMCLSSYVPFLDWLMEQFPEKSESYIVGSAIQQFAEGKGYWSAR